MIVFAAAVPHSPLLVPELGKPEKIKLSKTIEAMNKLRDGIKAAKPDTVIVMSNHTDINESAMIFNLNTAYTVNFEQFGEFDKTINFKGDINLGTKLKDLFNKDRHIIPLVVTSKAELNYASAVPMAALLTEQSTLSIVSLSDSLGALDKQFSIGERMYETLASAPNRVAIIASINLSHRHPDEYSNEVSTKAQSFDNRILDCLKSKKSDALANFSPATLEEVKECALGPLTLLLGMINGCQYNTDILSYEHPFGTGYAVIQFTVYKL